MYSYEDRVRAVKLYFELGRRLRLTLLKLGYPTKNSLIAWVREFEHKQNLKQGYQRQKWKYDEEDRRCAVEHYVENGHCLAYTRRTLGYPCRITLNKWIRELRPDLCKKIVGKSPSPAFSFPERQEAVIALNTRNGTGLEVAKLIGVSRPTLYNWSTQLLGEMAPKSMSKKKPGHQAHSVKCRQRSWKNSRHAYNSFVSNMTSSARRTIC